MIRFNPLTKTYLVSHSMRHPITNVPISLRRKGILSKSEAQRVFNQLVIEVNERTKGKPNANTFEIVLNDFFQSLDMRDLSASTVDNYKLCLNANTLPIWKGRKIETISTEEVRVFIRETMGNRSISHQKNLLKYLRGFFQFAVDSGVLAKSPVPKMQFRNINKIKPVLSEPQVKILLEKAKVMDHEWYPHWTTAVYTGMRNGELYALTWDKVDLENRKLLVSASWDSKHGFKDLTKSGEDRIVEIAPNLVVLFKELKLQYSDSVYVLPRIDAWDVGRQAEILRTFLMGIGLPRIRFHDLRASWATIMMSKGVEPAKVMVMGGWRDLKTMMIYIRKAGIDIKGITDMLDLHNPSRQSAVVLDFQK